MPEPVLIVEEHARVATLTLNRPKAMNAFSRELRDAIATSFRRLQAEREVRVIVLTGAGRAFCAGWDLKELSSPDATDTGEAAASDMQDAIAAFEGPILGAVNGPAITGGFELALACDLLIASSEARFADTHARVGILPGWGLSQKLPRLIGIQRAKEISFTGNFIDAKTAEAWGLVNRVVSPEELVPVTQKLAAEMATCVPHVLRDYKRLIDEGFGMPLEQALAYELDAAIASAREMTAETLAERRTGVLERGRDQDD
ncbi:MAG: enoyl-CoA hydratase [Myxococcota bacterium]